MRFKATHKNIGNTEINHSLLDTAADNNVYTVLILKTEAKLVHVPRPRCSIWSETELVDQDHTVSGREKLSES